MTTVTPDELATLAKRHRELLETLHSIKQQLDTVFNAYAYETCLLMCETGVLTPQEDHAAMDE